MITSDLTSQNSNCALGQLRRQRKTMLPFVDTSHGLLLLEESYVHKCCADKMMHCVVCFG